MPETGSGWPPYAGKQLADLADLTRKGLFAGGLLFAMTLVAAASPLVYLIDAHVSLRLMLLLVVGAFVTLGYAFAEECFTALDENGWWSLIPAAVAALVLAGGGARQNGTFIVIAAVFVTVATAADLAPAMSAGGIVAGGYLIGIVMRGQPLLVNGSMGDVAALVSFLVAIYGSHRVSRLVAVLIYDLNHDHLAAKLLEAELAQRVSVTQGSERTRTETKRAVAVAAALEPNLDAETARFSDLGLNDGQRAAAVLFGQGFTRKEIAERLSVSPKMVSDHREVLMNRLDLRTTAGLVGKLAEMLALPPQPPRGGSES